VRGWRYESFACSVDDSANVMLRLAAADMRYVTHVGYRPGDGLVRYEIDLAALPDKQDGQCVALVVRRALEAVVASHSVAA